MTTHQEQFMIAQAHPNEPIRQKYGGWVCSNGLHMFFYVHQSHRCDNTHPSLFTSWGALSSPRLSSRNQQMTVNFHNMLKFEPKTINSASEHLNHSATPDDLSQNESALYQSPISRRLTANKVMITVIISFSVEIKVPLFLVKYYRNLFRNIFMKCNVVLLSRLNRPVMNNITNSHVFLSSSVYLVIYSLHTRR